ncbi:unnamed protein product, partial [Urochloa humidicola]
VCTRSSYKFSNVLTTRSCKFTNVLTTRSCKFTNVLTTISCNFLIIPTTELNHAAADDELQSAMPSQHPGPVPEFVFISSNRPMARPDPVTTATKQGKAAAKERKAPKNSADDAPKRATKKSKIDTAKKA